MLKRLLFTIAGAVAACVAAAQSAPTPDSSRALVLWYSQPAAQWVEALPIGNGRLGAMVFGGVAAERLQLNEDTVWAGGPHHNNIPTAREAIPEIRRMIFAGDYVGASALAGEKVMLGKTRSNGMPFQPAGDLQLTFPGQENFSHYRRELSLDDAVARVSYDVGETHFTREVFSSLADNVIVVHLTSSAPGTLDFTTAFSTPHQKSATGAEGDDTLILTGTTSDHEGVAGKINF